MEKWIGLHMDELLLIMEKEIRGREMSEWLGNVKRGYTEKGIGRDAKTRDRTMEGRRWRWRGVSVGGDGTEEGKKKGIKPSRC